LGRFCRAGLIPAQLRRRESIPPYRNRVRISVADIEQAMIGMAHDSGDCLRWKSLHVLSRIRFLSADWRQLKELVVSLRWDDERYLTGVPVVDAQHKEMFSHIEQMITAWEVADKEATFLEMLDFLTGYVIEHFRCEEQVMEKRQCPALDENKADHERFREKLAEFKERFTQEGNTRVLREQVMGMAVQWLEAHIAGVDTQLRA
jgi:hemerythrin